MSHSTPSDAAHGRDNITVKETSPGIWEVVISDTQLVLGKITETDHTFSAYDAQGLPAGTFSNREKALTALIATP